MLKIRDLLHKNGITYTVLSQQSGIPLPTLKDIIKRDDCKVSALIKIAETLNVTLDDLVDLSDLLPLEESSIRIAGRDSLILKLNSLGYGSNLILLGNTTKETSTYISIVNNEIDLIGKISVRNKYMTSTTLSVTKESVQKFIQEIRNDQKKAVYIFTCFDQNTNEVGAYICKAEKLLESMISEGTKSFSFPFDKYFRLEGMSTSTEINMQL